MTYKKHIIASNVIEPYCITPAGMYVKIQDLGIIPKGADVDMP